MKSLEDRVQAIGRAIGRAYTRGPTADEIRTEHRSTDVRAFIQKTSGKPHRDLTVADVAALAVSRAADMSGDEALATTVADLMDGGVSLDREAAAVRGLDEIMARHRKLRAEKNPLPGDRTRSASTKAPSVVRRGGGSAIAVPPPPPPDAKRAVSGSKVRYLRLDDETTHDVVLGAPAGPPAGSTRVVPLTSPLGVALRGATAGTIVSAKLGAEMVEIEVVTVEGP